MADKLPNEAVQGRQPLGPEQVDRAISLRKTALRVLHAEGSWEDVEGYPGKVRSYAGEHLMILHRTPFQPVPVSAEATQAGIAAHLQRQAARAYGLDVWRDNRKVLSLIWDDGGSLGIVLFKQGVWEDELESLARDRA